MILFIGFLAKFRYFKGHAERDYTRAERGDLTK